MLYLAVSVGYLAAVIVATIVAAGVRRWLLAAGALAVGVVLVVPFRGQSLPTYECESTAPGAHCHLTGLVLQTVLGISVPYTNEIGLTASGWIGVGIVAVAVLATFLTPRYRARTSEQLAAPTAQPDV